MRDMLCDQTRRKVYSIYIYINIGNYGSCFGSRFTFEICSVCEVWAMRWKISWRLMFLEVFVWLLLFLMMMMMMMMMSL